MARNHSVDLHVHTTFSDGLLTPDQLVQRACLHNVTAIAFTDHDTLAGSGEKRAACLSLGIECIIGVELSCELGGREAHILSLFAEATRPEAMRIDELSLCRRDRMQAMLDRLATIGIKLKMPDLPVATDGVYGRPHLARAMVGKGIVKSVNEAFARYLYDDGPVHIAKTRFSAEEGISLAKELGGVAILAHPGVSGWIGELDAFVNLGVDGIEVYHPKHGGETVARLLRYCRDRDVLVSGGSDFHGPNDGAELGAAEVPLEVLEPIRALAEKRK